METEKKRVAPVIGQQKKILTEFLYMHENLRTGRFSNELTKKKAQELWEEITVSLNAVAGGSKKSWTQWRKTWQDMKKIVKAKVVAEKRHATGTGGGPLQIVKFDDTETKIRDILSPVATFGDPYTPVPNVEFDFMEIPVSENQINGSEILQEPITITQPEEADAETSAKSVNEQPEEKFTPEIKKYGKKIPIGKKRFTKTKRLDNSIEISNSLVKIEDEKKEISKNYMEEKKQYLIWRREYEKEKLIYLRRPAEAQEQILHKIKDLKTIIPIYKNKGDFSI